MKKHMFFERIQESVPFIDENNYRYHKTLEFIKDDAKMIKVKNGELLEINNEIATLLKKFCSLYHSVVISSSTFQETFSRPCQQKVEKLRELFTESD